MRCARFARMGDGHKRENCNAIRSSRISNVLEEEGGSQKWQERATWQTQIRRTSLLLSFPGCHSAERQTLPANAQANSRAIVQFFASSRIPSGATQQRRSPCILGLPAGFLAQRFILDAYPVLNKFRMGIDLFKSSKVTVDGAKQLVVVELKEDCGLTVEMARRLVENFQAWHKTLPARDEM
jgi:hypothetical protein